MKLTIKNYAVTLDDPRLASDVRAEIRFGHYALGADVSPRECWTGCVEINTHAVGSHTTRRQAQEALAGMLRALADKVMSEPVDPSE